MYQLVKNGKKTRHTFETYEQARQTARKFIRKLDVDGLRQSGQPAFHLQDYGFKIISH